MAENVVINDTTYNGVDALALVRADGSVASFYPDAVRYNAQTLTEAQKAQARLNLGVGSIDEVAEEVLARLGTPVFGRVDANNNIVLTGTLADGTYTIQYEDADGTVTEIGTLNHAYVPEPTYTNVLPLAVNSDKTPFVGTNGEKGYKTNTRMNSTGAESTSNATGIEITGFIAVNYGDILRFKNLTVNKDSANKTYCYFGLYDSSFTKLSNGIVRLDQLAESAYTKGLIKLDENNNFTAFTIGYETFPHIPDTSAVAYIRFSADEINDSSIITVNQEIK